MKEIFIAFLLLDHLIVFFLVYMLWYSHRRAQTKYERHSSDCIRFIEMLIDTVYTYKHEPQHLCDHIQQELTIKKLLSYHIVDEDCSHLFPPDFKCRRNDMLLYKLHMMGFTPKELCQLFNLNNINSVYVKCHRINKKLNPDRKQGDLKEDEN